mmetsp:Transcript_603/g.1015  ORF Transcript_603/g.1015 Transcript_603/m.1015 type:complete len:129 (+) Transcript_603:255-641(+)
MQRSERQRSTEEAALKRMFSSQSNERAEIHEREKIQIDTHIEIINREKAKEKEEDKKFGMLLKKMSEQTSSAEEEKQLAKREFARRVHEENKQLMEYRAQLKSAQRQRELEEDRRNSLYPEPWNTRLQ